MIRLKYRGTSLEIFISGQIDRITKSKDQFNKEIKLKTGFKDLDETLVGLQNSCLYLIASYPQKGKTTLLINILVNISNQNSKVLFISPTLSCSRVVQRIISCVTGIKVEHIYIGNLDDNELEKVKKFRTEEKKLINNFFCLDYPAPTLNGIRKYLYSLTEIERPEIIVIDDINILYSAKKDCYSSDSKPLMLELMDFAQEFEIPVIAALQIQKSKDDEDISFLQLIDLNKNGLCEQYASVIMFLENPQYSQYYETNLEKFSALKNETLIRIIKNEMGHLKTIKLVRNLMVQKFTNYPEIVK